MNFPDVSRRAICHDGLAANDPGADDDPNKPGGDGIGTVTVTKGGAVTLSGTLAEGTKITQATALSRNEEWPLHVSLHGGSI